MDKQPDKHLFYVPSIDSSYLDLNFCLRNRINSAWGDSVVLDREDCSQGLIGESVMTLANSTSPLLAEFPYQSTGFRSADEGWG